LCTGGLCLRRNRAQQLQRRLRLVLVQHFAGTRDAQVDIVRIGGQGLLQQFAARGGIPHRSQQTGQRDGGGGFLGGQQQGLAQGNLGPGSVAVFQPCLAQRGPVRRRFGGKPNGGGEGVGCRLPLAGIHTSLTETMLSGVGTGVAANSPLSIRDGAQAIGRDGKG
jgi:hypothetical protein